MDIEEAPVPIRHPFADRLREFVDVVANPRGSLLPKDSIYERGRDSEVARGFTEGNESHGSFSAGTHSRSGSKLQSWPAESAPFIFSASG